LSQIFTNTLEDLDLYNIFLIIDALNEYVIDLHLLLDYIAEKSPIFPRIKWIVSSCN
jgi:hypothetical protein